MTKVVPGTVAGVTTGGAQLPRARRFVLAGVQRARVGAVVAIEACQKEGNTGERRLHPSKQKIMCLKKNQNSSNRIFT